MWDANWDESNYRTIFDIFLEIKRLIHAKTMPTSRDAGVKNATFDVYKLCAATGAIHCTP